MMHLETKPIGELLLDVLADYGAAYAGCGMTEQLSMSGRRESPAKQRIYPEHVRECVEVPGEGLFWKF